MDLSKKLDQYGVQSLNYSKQAQANLDYILSLANVSSRGKAMLLRDLNRMEESVQNGEGKNEKGSPKTDEQSMLEGGGSIADDDDYVGSSIGSHSLAYKDRAVAESQILKNHRVNHIGDLQSHSDVISSENSD